MAVIVFFILLVFMVFHILHLTTGTVHVDFVDDTKTTEPSEGVPPAAGPWATPPCAVSPMAPRSANVL